MNDNRGGDDVMLTVEEVCQRYKVTRQGLFKWRKEHKIWPPLIIGSTVRWSLKALKTWESWGSPSMGNRLTELEKVRDGLGSMMKDLLKTAIARRPKDGPQRCTSEELFTPEEYRQFVPLRNDIVRLNFDIEYLKQVLADHPSPGAGLTYGIEALPDWAKERAPEAAKGRKQRR